MTIDSYTKELEAILKKKLSDEDAQEIATEAKNHLFERAQDLKAGGFADAEAQSILEFGSLEAMAVELVRGYPPRPPLDLSSFKWLAEAYALFLAVFMVLSGFGAVRILGAGYGLFSFSTLCMDMSAWMVLPGLFSALRRTKYRRLRLVKWPRRFAAYGVVFLTFGVMVLMLAMRLEPRLQPSLQFSGPTPLGTILCLVCVWTLSAYGLMRNLDRNSPLFKALHRRLSRP